MSRNSEGQILDNSSLFTTNKENISTGLSTFRKDKAKYKIISGNRKEGRLLFTERKR